MIGEVPDTRRVRASTAPVFHSRGGAGNTKDRLRGRFTTETHPPGRTRLVTVADRLCLAFAQLAKYLATVTTVLMTHMKLFRDGAQIEYCTYALEKTTPSDAS